MADIEIAICEPLYNIINESHVWDRHQLTALDPCFWNTHDFTDFSQETQSVNVRSTAGLTKQLMIRLDEETDHTLEVIEAAEDRKKATLLFGKF